MKRFRSIGIDCAAGAVEEISRCLSDSNSCVQFATLRILRWLGADAVDAISDVVAVLLKTSDEEVRLAAVKTLSAIDSNLDATATVLRQGVQCQKDGKERISLLTTIGSPARALRRKLKALDRETQPGRSFQSITSLDTRALKHSDDYRSVKWGGQSYSFTPKQAKIVKYLHHMLKNETPEVGSRCILTEIGSDKVDRLQDLFKVKGVMHSAWGELIVSGATNGSYRLNPDIVP